MVKSTKWLVRLGLAGALTALAGCAGVIEPQVAGGPPRVQDCGIVTIGSPTKYACNNKTYTSFDLTKLRLDWEKTHGS